MLLETRILTMEEGYTNMEDWKKEITHWECIRTGVIGVNSWF